MSTEEDDEAQALAGRAFLRRLADPTRNREPFRLEVRDQVESGVEWRIIDANGDELATGQSSSERAAREVAKKFRKFHEERVREWEHQNRPREWRDYPI